MGISRSRSRSRTPDRRRKRDDDSRRGRSPARRSDRSPDKSREDRKRRKRRRSRSGLSDTSRRRRRSSSRDREVKQFEFLFNKPAPGNRAWFTVELQDELYALRRELDRLCKCFDKMADTIKEESASRGEFVTMDKLKQAIEAALPEVVAKKTAAANSQQASKAKEAEPDVTKMASVMISLKKHLEEVRSIKYDLASLKGSVANMKTPAMRQFVSPRQMVANGKTPTKKVTPAANGGGPSSVKMKTRQQMDPRNSAARAKARRLILHGMQISEDMLSALQMEDLKQVCTMHNVRYRGMPQARVALRKIPGLIVSDTEDLPDRSITGEEV
ncbi:hypothetical protein CBR_g52241 [Chara braunii]|uniref:Uncharacterized protein n=1 Tax=Chara braunii TaxID=69332 RepID=A0A388M9V6_CHABU|nr:hypothetical protein CBR_g52241 [Chara braunii]|eukprot:GBG91354.1 hypothetical protein CBR_g52241 [Chara braunii]